MGLLSVPPVFFQYLTYPEFTRGVYWTRADKLAPVAGVVVGMLPLHLPGSHKITSLRVTGSNPAGGICSISIRENYASTGVFRQSIVGLFPTGTPFDALAVPAGGYYVTNPNDYNYALLAYAFGAGTEINIYNIEVEMTPIG